MTGGTPRQIYDPENERRLRARVRGTITMVIVICGIVAGVLVGLLHHGELPFLAAWLGHCREVKYLVECRYPAGLDWLAGGGAAVLFVLLLSPLIPVAGRRLKPAVYCRSCPGMGWVEDLVPSGGNCPRCRGTRFDHFDTDVRPIFTGGGVLFFPRHRWRQDVAGTELLAQSKVKKGQAD